MNNTLQKVQPLFGHFLENRPKIRTRIFSAADIFRRPFFCFAAEISAVGNTG
jgi:hypothetical protein